MNYVSLFGTNSANRLILAGVRGGSGYSFRSVLAWLGLTLLVVFPVRSLRAEESILMPEPSPAILALYQQPFASLTSRQQWRIKIHGLRLTPLHPAVWGPLRREQTDNRHLVPIKRFLLRDSVRSDFEFLELRTRFRFKAAKARYMAKMPHQKDPVFEIGFGGTFAETSIAEPLTADRFSLLRLTAFPELKSGLYIRDRERFGLVRATVPELLAVDESYELHLRCVAGRVSAELNSQPLLLEQPLDGGSQGCRGSMYLQTSWHPVFLDDLKIQARVGSGSDARIESFDGLVTDTGT